MFEVPVMLTEVSVYHVLASGEVIMTSYLLGGGLYLIAKRSPPLTMLSLPGFIRITEELYNSFMESEMFLSW